MIWPDGMRALVALDETVSGSGLDPVLLNLVRIRASQLNGCSYCLDLHTGQATEAGEQRVGSVGDWRAAACFTGTEQAALELTEALTRLPGHVEQALDRARRSLDETAIAKLVMAIAVINAWNRVGVAQRAAVPAG
jgi:AhpD family alkylhydroperoxidase